MAVEFHHIGMAVRDLDQASRALQVLGWVQDPELPDARDEGQGVELRFLVHQVDLKARLELVKGLQVGSPIENILEKSGPGPYHLCLEVDALSSTATSLKSAGYRAVTAPISAPAFSGRKIQFFYHAGVGLIECLGKTVDAQ